MPHHKYLVDTDSRLILDRGCLTEMLHTPASCSTAKENRKWGEAPWILQESIVFSTCLSLSTWTSYQGQFWEIFFMLRRTLRKLCEETDSGIKWFWTQIILWQKHMSRRGLGSNSPRTSGAKDTLKNIFFEIAQIFPLQSNNNPFL